MFLAESSDQLLVHGFITVLSEDAQQSLSLVQGLARLSNTSGQTVSDHGLLQHLLDGGVDVHGAGHGGGGWNVISLNIRHGEFLDVALVVSENNGKMS